MQTRKLRSADIGILLLLAAILFGAWFRIMPAWMSGFPINDGGMFYRMILDLQANHYVAPFFTTYNQSFIPFAYPPLGFYVGALISDLFNLPPLAVIRWLPGIISSMSIPSFYFFAKEVLDDRLQSAIAALVFAMTPHLSSWLSMGGGLTRSFGLLFMLLTLGYVHRVFMKSENRDILFAILFGGLTVLSHTEAPIYTIAIAIFIWAMKSRSLKGLVHGVLIALGVLILGGPWYVMVINRHGIDPFLSISSTGLHTPAAILRILNINFLTEEPYLGLLGALGVLGIATLVARRDYFIPLMLPVIFLVQPRSAHVMGNIPLAMAAGFFVAEILLPGLSKRQVDTRKLAPFFAILAFFMFGNSMYYNISLSQRHISDSDQEVMRWIEENTLAESTFLVITGDQNAFCDMTNEWFPALTNRESLTTVQGSEWVLGGAFLKNMTQIHRLQGCIDEGIECFKRESNRFSKPFDYVYISIAPTSLNCALSGLAFRTNRGLVTALENAPDYVTVFRSEKVVLFENKQIQP